MLNDESIIDIRIYYKKVKMKYRVLSEKEFNEINDLSNEERKKYTKLDVKMKALTWGLHNKFQDMLLKNRSNKDYKEDKLKTLIVKWNAKTTKNGEEVDVPVTEKNIENICPEIAEKILSEYDSEMFIDELKERKIATQVHSFIMGGGRSQSNISKEIIENDLIEEFHWLPQDIAKIPYKNLQMFYLIRKTKTYARTARKEVDALKNNSNQKKIR